MYMYDLPFWTNAGYYQRKCIFIFFHILKAIPNLTLLEPPEWEICCGSAGIYNIEKPEVAQELGTKKAANLMSTQPDAVALGNIGCMTQIQKHLESYETPPPVLHTVQLLARAYTSGK